MRKFIPTHRIGDNLYMEHDGGLYTFSEWSCAEACDYSFSDDGELLFQGQPARGPFYFVSKEAADAYEKMLDDFDDLSRIDWDDDDSDFKGEIFTAFGEHDSKGLFDPQLMVDYFAYL